MVRNTIFEASLFPFDAVSLSYFVRSTCLLRTKWDKNIRCFGRTPRTSWQKHVEELAFWCGETRLLIRWVFFFVWWICLTSAVQRVYFGRSTCLLRSINVLTSAEVRQRHQVFLENSSDLLANLSGFLAKEMPWKGYVLRGNFFFVRLELSVIRSACQNKSGEFIEKPTAFYCFNAFWLG